MPQITFSPIDRTEPTMHVVDVMVDGVTVGQLLRDPTAEMAEWYSHESDVLIDTQVHPVGLKDEDWGTTLREAKPLVRAYVRGQLEG